MPAAKSLVGQTFGRLVVIERYGSRQGRVNWLCRCDCGKLHDAVSHALTSGHTKSCGCWKDERNRATPIVHGHSLRGTGKSPTYCSWQAMLLRCNNPVSKQYKDYGGRGITICDRWLKFENFLTDMGVRPDDRTLDRINVDGNYEPGNCQWATRTEQARNTRTNKFVNYKGKRMTQAEFGGLVGLTQATVSYRLRKGWTPKQIAETPPYTGNRIASKLGDEVEIPAGLRETP